MISPLSALGYVGAVASVAPELVQAVGRGVRGVVTSLENDVEQTVGAVASGVANTVNAGVSVVEDGARSVGKLVDIFV